jgi:hypothetical protein
LSALGINNLSNTTDVNKLTKSPEKLTQVMDDLATVFTSLKDNTSELESGMV